MKRFTRLLLAVALACSFFAGLSPAARAASPQEAFTISNYDVHIDVSEANVFDVTETIEVNFTEPRHGIYREIPYRGTLAMQSEQFGYIEKRYNAPISDVSVDGYQFTTDTSDGNYEIKIGDPDETVAGRQVYRISYRMRWGNDGIPDFDEVYYNLIGNGWDTQIGKVNFTIQLPKPFDAGKVGFAAGLEGEARTDAAQFEVKGNTVTGSTTRPLTNHEGLTMRVELPQGYFQVPDDRWLFWLLMGLMVAAAVLCVALFLLFGRDDRPVQTVEFYAPDGMTPSEIGYILDGNVDDKDVVSLLMYWAHKGYLTIEETGDKCFRLDKVRDMGAEAKDFERHMFQKLFHHRDSVTTDELKYTFYTTVNSTKSMVQNSFEASEKRVFTKASTGLQPLLSFLTALPVIVTLLVVQYRSTYDPMETLFITAIIGGLILLPVYFLIGTMRRWRADRPVLRMAKLVASLTLTTVALAVFLALTMGQPVPALPLVAVLATLSIGLTAVFIRKRTPRGVEWLGETLGFRSFIEEAERDKLERLVEQDPGYFYGVLPYAYVLGVTDKWAKNFEPIALQPPQWYRGDYGTFTPILFTNHLASSMAMMQAGMTARPQSSGGGGSGGGGFSGGGFSGGGGGGGGGGSW